MLTSITLENFKGHTHTTVPLGRLTVLVGPNGSGKTSVLQALRFLGQFADGQKEQEVVPDGLWRDLKKAQTPGQTKIKVEGTEGELPFVACWEFDNPVRFTWKLGKNEGEPGLDFSWKIKGSAGEDLAQIAASNRWREHLRTATLYRFNPLIISAPASSQNPRPIIEFDGRNTAVVLKAMKLGYDEQWAKFRQILQDIVPSIENIGVEQVQPEDPRKYSSASQTTAPPPSGEWSRIFFNFKGAQRVPAFNASEGTLLTVALLAVLLGPARPRLILLDDIEQALHPHAQMDLMRNITKLLDDQEEFKDVQIVATTHSPYILQDLRYEQVHVFAVRADGSVASRCLAQHPDAEKMRGVQGAADLWTSDPEVSWVAAPEPGRASTQATP